jgi:hypothetical protein
MSTPHDHPKIGPELNTEARAGWDAALRELEHLAEHWARPANGEEGEIIARGLRDAALILRTGGLVCEHRRPQE